MHLSKLPIVKLRVEIIFATIIGMKGLGIFFSVSVIATSILYALFSNNLISVPGFYYYSVCNTPITYAIGKVDPEFGLTQDEFLKRVEESVGLWNSAFGKKLFVYDANSELDVNLSYDARTGLNTEIRELENELDARKSSLDPSIATYKRKVAEYEAKLSKLNEEISYWNSQGGAPEAEFARLTKEQHSLQAEAQTLQELAASLNQSTATFNSQVGQLNQKVQTFNSALQVRPEEGLYDPQSESITVYFNTDQNELIHTLAHEFGHARGLEHISDEESIMYPMTTDIISLASSDIAAMNVICAEKPLHTVFIERLQLITSLIFLRFNK